MEILLFIAMGKFLPFVILLSLDLNYSCTCIRWLHMSGTFHDKHKYLVSPTGNRGLLKSDNLIHDLL